MLLSNNLHMYHNILQHIGFIGDGARLAMAPVVLQQMLAASAMEPQPCDLSSVIPAM